MTWPQSGTWADGYAYELPTSAPPTDGTGCSSSPPTLLGTPSAHERTHSPRQVDHGAQLANQVAVLLPTPSAQESDPTEEFVAEMEGRFDPGARMYLPGRKWFSQRTLARAAALLPSPCARDDKDPPTDPDPAKGRLPDAVKLLPTPAAADSDRAADTTRDERGAGGDDLATVARLLPTPTSSDARGATTPATADTPRDGTNLPEAVQGVRLLPTPRTSADRASRKSLVEDRQWTAPDLEQALELARGELPREYENWEEVRGWHGGLTPPRSSGGPASSAGQLPLPLTSEDD